MVQHTFSRALLLPILVIFVLLLPGRGEAVPSIDCFSCHDRAAFQKKVKHSPAGEGDCFACHNPHVARFAGLLQRDVPRLCYTCHEDMAKELTQAVVHRPVREGECISCHNPHSSDQNNLLNARPADLCFTCHTTLPKKFKYTHAPYEKGQCTLCHNAHQSANPALLVKTSDKLCLDCHSAGSVQKKHSGFPEEVKNCGSCHSPHGSNNPSLVRNVLHEPFASGCKDCHTGKGVPVGIDTCLGCHDDVGEQMASSHNHLVRYRENGCIACHSPHAGDDERLLKGRERFVCSTCHLDTFQRYDSAHFKHVTTDTCMDCHVPHGSNFPNMTKAPTNKVCATCHEKHSEFTHPIGEKVFDPRTLQTMTCISCHSLKGTEFESFLRFNGSRDLCLQCHRDI